MKYIMMFQSTTDQKQIRALAFRYPFLVYASFYILNHAEEADEHQIGQDAFLQRLLDEPETLEKIRLFHSFFEVNYGFRCARGANLLYMLAYNRHYRLTKALLNKNIDINAQGGYWGNALQAAVGEDNIEMVKLLLEEGADVNAQCGYYGNALQIAAAFGRKEHVELLLERGAYVNAQGGYFGNALQAAADHGNNEVVKMLLKEGADIYAQGGYFGNALCAAAAGGEREVLEMLLKEGANVNTQGGPYGNALCAAAIENEADAVRFLLENGADVDSKTEIYGNALQAATIQGNETIMELLVEAGADTNPPESYFSPGDQAAITLKSHGKLLDILLKKRAHVSPSTQKALLIFFEKAMRKDVREETKEILLKENIEAHNQWIYDYFCYIAMERMSNDDAAVRLAEKGANPNSYKEGLPIGVPLAILYEAEGVIAVLLDNGADINAPMIYTGVETKAQMPESHTYQHLAWLVLGVLTTLSVTLWGYYSEMF
jgi:ankyrin repeat protein